jgi:hypothetical protein
MSQSRTSRVVWSLWTIVLASTLVTTGCPKKGPAERAGESIDRGVEKAGDAVQKAGDKVEDATD